MRLTYRPGTRGWLLFLAAVLVLSGLAAGCSSSKPAYCTAATNLKTSVSNLSNVDVAKNGLSSLQTALTSVQANANTFASEAKSAYPSQTTALQNSLSSLENAIKSAEGEPSAERGRGGRPSGHPGEELGKRAAECCLGQMLVTSRATAGTRPFGLQPTRDVLRQDLAPERNRKH